LLSIKYCGELLVAVYMLKRTLVAVYISVADPGCLFRIPDPDFTHPGSRISDPGSKNSNKRER
jgi:hypothetical protein